MTKVEILKMMDNEIDKAVKIQGTKYDRKRKYQSDVVKKMQNLLKKGKTYQEVAAAIGCAPITVRYNTDAEFKAAFNAARDGKHTGKDRITKSNRIAYKRQLVAEGKVTA